MQKKLRESKVKSSAAKFLTLTSFYIEFIYYRPIIGANFNGSIYPLQAARSYVIESID